MTVMMVAGTVTLPSRWIGADDGLAGQLALRVTDALGSSPSETAVRTDSDDDRTVDEQFGAYARQWRRESVRKVGRLSQSIDHSAYRAIVELGWAVVPALLRELLRKQDHWFPALAEITGENPVPEQDSGNLTRMTDAWVSWGRSRGFI